jgi:hypothetical protein
MEKMFHRLLPRIVLAIAGICSAGPIGLGVFQAMNGYDEMAKCFLSAFVAGLVCGFCSGLLRGYVQWQKKELLPIRYQVRTLLVAITVFAIALGVFAYFAR